MERPKKIVKEVEDNHIGEKGVVGEVADVVIYKKGKPLLLKTYRVSDKFYAEDGFVINKDGKIVSKQIGQAEAEKVAQRFNK